MKYTIHFLSIILFLSSTSLLAQENPFASFGQGIDGQVLGVETAPNGDLYVGGMMAVAGTKRVQNIVKYDGENWIDIGRTTSPLNYVRGMQLVGDNLYVAFNVGPSWDNEFITPGGAVTNLINSGLAVYNIQTGVWSGVSYPEDIQSNVFGMTTDGNTLYLGGTSARLWQVNGTQADSLPGKPRVGWSPSPAPMVEAVEYHEGKLYVGGRFDQLSYVDDDEPSHEAYHVAAFNLTTFSWETLGEGFAGSAPLALAHVHALHVDDTGVLYAGGLMNEIRDGEGRIPTNGFAKWDGSGQWEPVGLGADPDDNRNRINSITSHDGKVYVAGRFEYVIQADGTTLDTKNFAVWDGNQWEVDGHGNASTGLGLSRELRENDLVSLGSYTTSNQQVTDILRVVHEHDGSIYVGGNFDRAMTGPDANERIYARGIVRYKDGDYFRLGRGVDDLILDAVKVGNDYYITGLFTYGYNHGGERVELDGVAKYITATGTLEPLGNGIGPCKILSPTGRACSNYGSRLIYDEQNSDLYLGGRFNGAYQTDGTFVESPMAVRWDGSSWQAMGNGLKAGHDIMDYDWQQGPEMRWVVDMKKHDNKIWFAGDIQEIDGGNVPGRLAAVWDISSGSWDGIPLPEDYDAYSFRSITITDDDIFFGARIQDTNTSERSERFPIVRYDRHTGTSERFNLTGTFSSITGIVSNIIADGDFLYIFLSISSPAIIDEDGELVRIDGGMLLIYDKAADRWSAGQATNALNAPTDRIFKKGNSFYILNSNYSGRHQTNVHSGKEFMTYHMGNPPEGDEFDLNGAFMAASPIDDNTLLLTGSFMEEDGDFVNRVAEIKKMDDFSTGPLPQLFQDDIEKDIFSVEGDDHHYILHLGNLGTESLNGSFEVNYLDGAGWLSFPDTELAAASSGEVEYLISIGDLEPGVYRAEVTLQDNGSGNGELTFPVEIHVDPLRKPWNPMPEHEQRHVALDTHLEWEIDHVTEDVYVLFSTTSENLMHQNNLLYHGEAVAAWDSLPGLDYETTYYWQILVENEDGHEIGDVWSFTTIAENPDFIVLETPENGAAGVNLTPVFTWKSNDGFDSYQLQLSLNSEFSDLVIDSTSIADTTITLTEPLDPEEYFWRVRGNDNGTPGDWSHTWSFSAADDVPDAVVLIFPENEAEEVEPETGLIWNESKNADTYQLQVALDDEFNQFHIDSTGIADTTFSVAGLEGQTEYFWRVKAANASAESGWSEVWSFVTKQTTGIEGLTEIPKEASLHQNYPNPFNPATQIRFGLPENADVSLEVFNLLGQRVAVLVNEHRSAGYHEVTFDARSLSSGMYIYHIQAGDFVKTKKLLLLK